ncbi:MAG: hypothetical protein P1T08_06970 [Acidimicrobiia bacterium]|nr:hypothetical protein [Acidimicrobiia bacterium]
MLKRITAVVATLITALLAVGIVSAAVGPSSDDSTSTTATSAPTAATLPVPGDSETVIYEVGDAGTVTLASDGTALSIVAAEAAESWTAEVEAATGLEVEADFRNGTRRLQFKAEFEDGEVRVEVRERADDNAGDDDSTSTTVTMPDDSGTTPTSLPDDSSTTSTSTPDDSSTTSTSMPDGSSSTSTTLPSAGGDAVTVTYDAGGGGTVTIARKGSNLSIVATNPAAGWSHEVEVASGLQVEADFRNGGRRIQFDAEIEDGEVRIRIRESNG